VRDRDGRAGIWFFSLDAERLGAVAVARAAYNLPYYWSSMQLAERDGEIAYTCRRLPPGQRAATSRARIRIGDRLSANELDERDHFLTARWILFSVLRTRRRLARACHQPWPLHRAQALACDDRLIAAAGLPQPSGEPLVHYSPGVDVRIGRPEKEDEKRAHKPPDDAALSWLSSRNGDSGGLWRVWGRQVVRVLFGHDELLGC